MIVLRIFVQDHILSTHTKSKKWGNFGHWSWNLAYLVNNFLRSKNVYKIQLDFRVISNKKKTNLCQTIVSQVWILFDKPDKKLICQFCQKLFFLFFFSATLQMQIGLVRPRVKLSWDERNLVFVHSISAMAKIWLCEIFVFFFFFASHARGLLQIYPMQHLPCVCVCVCVPKRTSAKVAYRTFHQLFDIKLLGTGIHSACATTCQCVCVFVRIGVFVYLCVWLFAYEWEEERTLVSFFCAISY